MSLTAKELRIGNYIYCKGGIIKVTLIGYYGVQSSINGTTINAKFNTPDLEPIPLTEQWLLDFGFERDVYCNELDLAYFSKGNISFTDVLPTHIELVDYELSPCDYVHHLQNLYFALTGEELKTK